MLRGICSVLGNVYIAADVTFLFLRAQAGKSNIVTWELRDLLFQVLFAL